MPGYYEIDNSMKPEGTKQQKIDAIDEIWEWSESDRQDALVGLAEDYFTHYGIRMPFYLWENEMLNPLIYPESKKDVKKALSDIKDYAIKYHNEHTPTVPINDDVTKYTLIKILKKTFYGSRLDEMGKYGGTLENINQGYITVPVIQLIVNIVLNKEKPSPDLIKAFKDKNKISFIRQKLSEL